VAAELPAGTRLPTVRALARELGTSPATVSSAYRTLQVRGLVHANGRRGTRVTPRPALRSHVPTAPPPAPSSVRDLTAGLADPELLPELGPALARVAGAPPAPVERGDGADPRLLEFARSWFAEDRVAAGSVAVVSGAMDGLERVLAAHLRAGDRVLIEDPAYPPIIDLLLALGLIAVPVPVDERGLVPDALGRALARGAAGLVLVPRGQNPTGAALDPARAAELRAVLAAGPELLVVEDDHLSCVSGVPFHSAIAPDRRHWAIVRSLSKLVHPDLRVALLAGDETTVARLEGRQMLGPRWVSHVLQSTAATLLRDPGFEARCARAAGTYAARRRALIEALAARGIGAAGGSGLNVWVPVAEEAPVVHGLAQAGWLVLAGERFRSAAPPAVRVTTATLRDGEAERLAGALADVTARPGRPRSRY
jgi:DNA-binding transcriptional MocR family regulator